MKLRALLMEIRNEYQAWNDIAEHGCRDPFWEDGANMNIIRNHIIYLKKQIITRAEKEKEQIPQEFYWALLPEVPDTYMVESGRCYKRCKKWDKERISETVLKADTDAALF
ncbi:hypothetical protein [uncultured Acidaminococcus sp.]|uniref:hypothetical protein n=1 Tax=uncultured Acidaminococcus sp. TaxID=352152 RepID=UPI002598C227|nr:hypothetical protein [uncultured Acidaminococcus sp.]